MTIPQASASRGRRSIDTPVTVAGGVLSGLLGLGVALLFGSWADTGRDVGPTAASLNEAFSQLVWRRRRLSARSSGRRVRRATRPPSCQRLIAGLIGHAAVLAPALIITAPSDVSTGDAVFTAAYASILLVPAVLAGAMIGAAIAGYRERARLG